MSTYERIVVGVVLVLISVECLVVTAMYRNERKRVDALEVRLYNLEKARPGQTP